MLQCLVKYSMLWLVVFVSTSLFKTYAFAWRGFSLKMTSSDVGIEQLKLPTKLRNYVTKLRSVGDDRLRYQQLLFMAEECPPMQDQLKISENKVPGCLSTVYIHARQEGDLIYYTGDSDSQLTKGLAAILVEGLSGSSAEEILDVNPEFIKYAGIGASLTPGRNNGFLNMLKLMKQKALAFKTPSMDSQQSADKNEVIASSKTPIYDSMYAKLKMLQPIELTIENESHKHAGHVGVSELNGSQETHFRVKIVANCFEGLSLVKRHQLVYTLLGQEMKNGIHALSLDLKTSNEAK